MVQNEIMSVECLGCGEPIHPKRLEILPNTKHCVSCSDVGRKRGVTVQRGEGDHSYTDVAPVDETRLEPDHAPAVPLNVEPTPKPQDIIKPAVLPEAYVPDVSPAIVILLVLIDHFL